MTDASVIDTPLMEPSLSKVTELLRNMKMAENPMVKEALIRNTIKISKPQNSQELERKCGQWG